MSSPGTKKLANRHVAKLLDNLEALTNMPPLARTAVRKELHWLAADIEAEHSQKHVEHGDARTYDRKDRQQTTN